MDHINKHGGDIYSYIEAHGNKPIDFSANINPLGLPKSVKKALRSNMDSFTAYPDVSCLKLKTAISLYEGVREDNIIVGNGAADIIFKICYAIRPRNALLTAPTFSEYEEALKNVDCGIDYYLLDTKNDFIPQSDVFENIKGKDILFLCNPNNPTGRVIDKTFIRKIAEKCRQENCILVIDECFMDFVLEKNNYSFIGSLSEYDHVFILKAFTKIFAMAGLRLGYCLSSNKNLLSRIEKMGQPWSVSTPAQIAGIEALKDEDYISRTIRNTARERKYLTRELKKVGLRVFHSDTNFILFQTNNPIGLYGKLYDKGILIRKCENFKGLNQSFYRIAVKSRNDNCRLIGALSEILEEWKNG